MSILNLTQHKASAEQVQAGVVDLPGFERDRLAYWLTFDELPTMAEIEVSATAIANIADNYGYCEQAMIGGAPFMMEPLQRALSYVGIKAVYAFSTRESVESTNSDGSVVKQSVFRHLGFVGLDRDNKMTV